MTISVPHIHFVGIGGIGMSGLARVLLEAGYQVSGCDRQLSHITDQLAAMGATIYVGHDADHIPQADVVVVSSAIPDHNPDLAEARRRDIPIVKRAEMLGHLTRDRQTVAVAGTHGKTTTTGMIGWILEQAGVDPTIFVGGELVNLETNAKRGTGAYAVVEADEYDRSFLTLTPALAIVTSLEVDHPDIFRSIDEVVQSFAAFLEQVQPDGRIIACADYPHIRNLVTQFEQVVSYGIEEPAMWQAHEIRYTDTTQTFVVTRHGSVVGEFNIQLPGVHNVSNALAAIVAAVQMGVDLQVVREALATFRGTRRRFEEKGRVADIVVVDDYAHHPTEVQATLAAARQRFGRRPLWVVFQPHTYSRTHALLDVFARSFEQADYVIITDIYAAREQNTYAVHAQDLVKRMHRTKPLTPAAQAVGIGGSQNVQYIATLEEAADFLARQLTPHSVVLTLGAGDVWKVGTAVLERLASEPTIAGTPVSTE